MTLSLILAKKGHEVLTARPEHTLTDVARLLSEKGIGAIIVVDPVGRLLGIVSERDIVRSLARSGASVLSEPVSQHMTTTVTTATETMSVADAMSRMTEGRFRHLPVVDGDRVAGVISIGDLVKHRLAEMEHDHRAMLDYITAA